MRRMLLACSLPILALSLAACGDDGDDLVASADIEAALVEQGVPADVAECAGESIAEARDEDGMAELSADDLDDQGAPSAAFQAAIADAMTTCAFEDAGLDDGPAVGEGIEVACDAYGEWETTGDEASLEELRATVNRLGVASAEEIDEAIQEIQTMETETADQQAAFEGAVDFVRGELIAGGCDL